MLRSRRCTECGNLFMTAETETRVCGNCRGEQPQLVTDEDVAAIKKANAATQRGPQTVDIKALANLGKNQGVSDIGPKPAPKKTRRNKATNAAPADES